MSNPESIVLNCYELAKYYHVDPRVFLEQGVSAIERHRYWTEKLADKIRAAQEAEAPSDG